MNGLEELALDTIWMQTAVGIMGLAIMYLITMVAYMKKLEHKETMKRLEGKKEPRMLGGSEMSPCDSILL